MKFEIKITSYGFDPFTVVTNSEIKSYDADNLKEAIKLCLKANNLNVPMDQGHPTYVRSFAKIQVRAIDGEESTNTVPLDLLYHREQDYGVVSVKVGSRTVDNITICRWRLTHEKMLDVL